MDSRAFWLTKRGNEPDDYEDACAVDSAQGRFAIADGATESSFARTWAKLLVDQYVELPVRWQQRWRDWLPPLQQRWVEEVGRRPLPWYAESKVEQGAFATFLGLLVEPVKCQRWWAVAVGDSCLFQVRDDQLLTAFPLIAASEFSNQPSLIGSRTPVDVVTAERERFCHGECRSGDRFFLATDALAHWVLKQHEQGAQPWQTILTACQPPADTFAAWIETLRDAHEIRNDDVTLIVIDV